MRIKTMILAFYTDIYDEKEVIEYKEGDIIPPYFRAECEEDDTNRLCGVMLPDFHQIEWKGDIKEGVVIIPIDIRRFLQKYIEGEAKMIGDVGYYTIRACAELANVSDKTIRNYIKNGKLNAEKRGKSIYIKKEDIDKLLQ